MNRDNITKQPLAEVFGFPIVNTSPLASRYRKFKLCPFNNKVPNCTKDKADNPLGVCSVYHNNDIAITCPIRFRQDWLIAEHAANFFFPENTSWTSLTEVRLDDKDGLSAGNIDVVLVAYDSKGKVLDFGALEIQAVYISGNIRKPFEYYMENPVKNIKMDWKNKSYYPRPDYLSSSRKRLVPQLIYKGGILNSWQKKMAVALDKGFYNTLPSLKEIDSKHADIAWLIYDLRYNERNLFSLETENIVYTSFSESLDIIAKPNIGKMDIFMVKLQEKLDEKLENSSKPDTKMIEFEN